MVLVKSEAGFGAVRSDGPHSPQGPHWGRFQGRARPYPFGGPRSGPGRVRMHWPEPVLGLLRRSGPSFEQLVARLTVAHRLQRPTRVAVLSAEARAGRTTVALAVACQAAQCGETVLLVDVDCAHPDLAAALGLAQDDGVDPSVVEAGVEAPAAAWRPIFWDRRLRVGLAAPTLELTAPTGCTPQAIELLLNEWRLLASRASTVASLVIFDTAPRSHPCWVPLEQLGVEAVIVVQPYGKSDAAHVESLEHELTRAGVELVAVAETFHPWPPMVGSPAALAA
jgi:hypothetical protein